ncbi:Flp family type IVb pilin [Bacillus massilinigeriensis]|uniref:Flp family type IVb pilin n=1 Tax=Bacillus massilionigeriensis TaxID=1805475 RepID=UPI00096B22D0|nr:Flp family type IVb pilin [Bacillus massilionigeriensis]
MENIKRLLSDEDGQSMTEYALILGLIVVAAVAAFAVFNEAIVAKFNDLKTTIMNAGK